MASGGTGNTLWVDDTAVTTAKEARVSGYATMSNTTPTGTGQFPTSAQSAIGTGMLVIRKSTTADSTTRVWTIVADGHTFYLFAETGDFTSPVGAFSFYFGDFFSYSTSDTSNCIIMGRQTENSTATQSSSTVLDPCGMLVLPNSTCLSNTLQGMYVAANFTNVGGSLACGKHTDQTKMGWNAAGNQMIVGYLGSWQTGGNNNTWVNEFAYPNPPDSGLYMAPMWIHHQGIVRGYFKGLWAPLQHMPLNERDTFSGTGNLSGKSFSVFNLVAPTNASSNVSGTAGQVFVETSNTWS
jgi:hypothetical protein